MNFLEKVVEEKKIELQEKEATLPLEMLKKEVLAQHRVTTGSFQTIFKQNTIVVIAEIKLKSPSEGMLTNQTHIDIAKEYAKSEADAISILTEPNHFNGKLEYIEDVRDILPQPILRKDFIISEYHIYETAKAGADAFLLIAAILTTEELSRFISLGKELGLSALVEIHNEEDLEKALSAKAEIIGINNRDLTTLKIDLHTSARLMPLIPKNVAIVSESGIKTVDDVRFLKELGIHGILVGSSIIKNGNYVEAIRELKHA